MHGVHFSANVIHFGVEKAQQGSDCYKLAGEGELVSYHTETLEEQGLADYASKVSYQQSDACNLKPRLTGNDRVLAASLIDHLYKSRRCQDSIHERINGGLLVTASPYTWLQEHTPREEWKPGFKEEGVNHTTLDGLKKHLGSHFRLGDKPSKVPFVIRETQHKFEHTLSQVTVWERLPR